MSGDTVAPAAAPTQADVSPPAGAQPVATPSSHVAARVEGAIKHKKKKHRIKLHIAHHTPGRVRMKIPAAKGDPEALRQVGEAFGVLPGVEHVSINVTTGSVTLHYDDEVREFHDHLHHSLRSVNASARAPQTELDQLANRIEKEAKYLAEHSHTAKAAVQLFTRLDHEIKAATNNNFDLKIGLAIGVIGVTVLEIGASAATPVWLTLTVFTLNHFVELHQPQRRLAHAPAVAPIRYKTPR